VAKRLGQVQPSVGYPQGAVSFLRALVAPDTAALGVWATTARPDARWAEWLRDQQLAAHAFYRLHAAGLEDRLSPEPRDLLRAAFYGAAGGTMLRKRELANALQALGAVGIIPVLFKGAALAHTVYPDPARGVKENLYVFNQLSKGKAGGVEAGVEKDADMKIAGSYDVWKEVVEGNKDPIKAIMNKELVFEGDLKKVMKYMKAVKLLMDNVQKVPTDWHTK